MAEVRRMQGYEAPEHLSEPRKTLYATLVAQYAFDAASLELLRLLCEALDRLEEARQAVDEEGLVVPGRYGPRANPAVAIERDTRIAVARLLRELGLESEPAATAPLALRPRRSDHR
jgi:phage terminase small subunit